MATIQLLSLNWNTHQYFNLILILQVDVPESQPSPTIVTDENAEDLDEPSTSTYHAISGKIQAHKQDEESASLEIPNSVQPIAKKTYTKKSLDMGKIGHVGSGDKAVGVHSKLMELALQRTKWHLLHEEMNDDVSY